MECEELLSKCSVGMFDGINYQLYMDLFLLKAQEAVTHWVVINCHYCSSSQLPIHKNKEKKLMVKSWRHESELKSLTEADLEISWISIFLSLQLKL